MNEASIPVDLYNPGQVFACLGFMEVTEILIGDVQGRFDWKNPTDTRFLLRADFDGNPFKAVVSFLLEADYFSATPKPDILERDGGETRYIGNTFPCRLYDEKGKARNALLPIIMTKGNLTIVFETWCDLDSKRPPLQLWTATNGNSAFKRFEKVLNACKFAAKKNKQLFLDPLEEPAPVAANFRYELRRNWTSLNIGFSPDKINKKSALPKIEPLTFPFVELLAAFGLNNARPQPNHQNRLNWRYSVWDEYLPTALARSALQQVEYLSTRHFSMILEAANDGGDLSISGAEDC